MKPVFRRLAPSLTLTAVFAAVSVNLYAERATGKASATVVAPAVIGGTATILSPSTFTSDTTGDLIVRIPGAGSSGGDGDYFNPISTVLMAGLANGCVYRAGSLADCFEHNAGDGALRGDPVTSLSLKVTDDTRPDGTVVQITVAYN